MPCTDNRPNPLKEDLDRMTRFACTLARQLNSHGLPIADKEIAEWWELHQAEDVVRKLKEKMRGLKS